MREIEVFSGTIETVVSAKPFSTGDIELIAINDNGLTSARVYSRTQGTFKAGGRINGVGQWRKVRRTETVELHFYAASLFHVPHLLDTDESWLSDIDTTDLQKQRLLDTNCILQQLGIDQQKSRILNLRHKERLLHALTASPFKILEEGGLPFTEADKFAKSLGLAPTTADRAAAGIRDILKSEQSIELSKLKEIAIKNYCLFWPLVPDILDSMQDRSAIEIHTHESGVEIITVIDLEKSKKTSKTVALSTGNIATDLLILREGDSFVWDEVVRTISASLDSPIKTTPNLILVIDTATGELPRELPGKINNLIQGIGSKSLHCSALKPRNSTKTTAFERYLVGIGEDSPELVIIEDSHLLDFKKIQFLAQRLHKTEGLILMGDGSYGSRENPLNLLIASQKVPTLKLNNRVCC